MKELPLLLCSTNITPPPFFIREVEQAPELIFLFFFLSEKKKDLSVWSKQALLEPIEDLLFEVSFTDTLNEGLTDKARENGIWAQPQCLLTRLLACHRLTQTQPLQCEVNLFWLSLSKQMWPWEFLLHSDKSRTRPFRAPVSMALEGDVRFLWEPLISHYLD